MNPESNTYSINWYFYPYTLQFVVTNVVAMVTESIA